MRRIVLASQNKGKIRELQQLMADLPVAVVGVDQYPAAPTVAETGQSFAENAFLKAKAIGDFSGELTLADDSGLEVDALGGEPGVYSARYGKPEWDDRQRYRYLLEKLRPTLPAERTARFRCAAVLYDPVTQQVTTAEGTVAGLIIDQPRGENGFGYDPVFYLPQYQLTMAELSVEQKNQFSHRSRAIQQLLPIIKRMIE